MESILFGLTPLVVGVALLLFAFRAHERYWALGFMGWRKVYAGLVLFLFSGILTAVWPWTIGSGQDAVGRLVLWQMTSALAAAAGIGLLLAGAIERLRELAEERERLEDIRAGFDLFDSLREITAQPYAFLEVLDFSLKEIVRAAGAECGGVWLHNPGRAEWVLTGWAGMSEKLRQQTESVRGSGTGLDRLAITHKARLFHSTEELRVFFPEWEPEGFRSILGLPLATGTIGTPGRQILGVIILADRSPSHFDDDRVRRLYAASDYIAAVIAEARITRQLEAARQQLDSTHAEWERDKLEAQNQLQIHEKRVQDLIASWESEKRSLERDFAERLSDFQAHAEAESAGMRAEWEREKQEFLHQRQTDEQTLREAKTAWDEERHSLEENLATQLRDLQTRTGEETAQLRADFDKRTEVAGAAEQERTSQLQQRWEEARRDYESALARFENERAEWGRRLDQLNQDHQTERELARRREEQLVAANQDAQAAAQQRIDKLQSLLASKQQELAGERDALQAAGQTLAELETELIAERIARDNVVADFTARLENERKSAAADRQAVERDLHSARQLFEEREKQLSAHLVAARQAAAEAQVQYQETLEAQREASERAGADLQTRLHESCELRQSVEDELRSTRLMFDERERQFAARIEAERNATKDLEAAFTAALSDECLRFEDIRRDLENRLRAQDERTGSLVSNLRNILDEKAALEERSRQELVEQHLNSRRQINAVKSRRARIMDRLQHVLRLRGDEERLLALFESVADDLPAPVELYLWQRDPEHGAHLAAWMDRERIMHPAPPLPAWSFEVETIPAEGVTRLNGGQHWDAIERAHNDAHCTRWREHWGNDNKPTWVTCWPWRISLGDPGAENRYVTGWVTAFGFGPEIIDDEQVISGSQWVGFLASAVAAANAPLSSPSSGDAQSAEESPAVMYAEAPETLDDLNSVILNWAAGQTEDPLRLELSASSKVAVEPSRLRDLLDRGRRLCRSVEHHGSEFNVSTESHNGTTILRLIRSSYQTGPAAAEITTVDDADLTAMQVSGPSVPDGTANPRMPGAAAVSGRWLVSNGDRLGLELHFGSHGSVDGPDASGVTEAERPHMPGILVVNFQDAMNELLVGMIESLGHRVRSTDVAAARDVIVSQGSDLVIIAATPETAGWELAQWLRNSIPAIPVIVVTDDDASGATTETAYSEILRIPFQIQELEHAIGRLTTRETIPTVHE